MHSFTAKLEIIGANPFVFVPANVLDSIFRTAGKSKGPIPVCGTINDTVFTQTLVRYSGEWRLYINAKMLPRSPKRIGEVVRIQIAYDPNNRELPMHPKLERALQKDSKARAKFEMLTLSLQQEMIRYITNLKSEAKVDENVQRAINFLNGKGRFLGRDPS